MPLGKARALTIAFTRSATFCGSRRLKCMTVLCAKAAHGAANSGRHVSTTITCSECARSTMALNSSSEVGSIHCTSSHTQRTGFLCDNASSCRPRAASVISFRFCGEIWASELTLVPELESRSEISDISSGDGPLGDRTDFSFSRRCSLLSFFWMWAERSRRAMRGWRGLLT